MNEVRKTGEAAGLKINIEKTKTVITGKENTKDQIELEDINIEKSQNSHNLVNIMSTTAGRR